MDELLYMLDDGAYEPTCAHDEDAGYDLKTPVRVCVESGAEVTVDTGVHFLIPKGFYGKLESKSGLMCKFHVITVGGVIDASYTGSIAVQIRNNGKQAKVFDAGDKITQIIFQRCEKPVLKRASEFPKTDRGDNGFGSSGK